MAHQILCLVAAMLVAASSCSAHTVKALAELPPVNDVVPQSNITMKASPTTLSGAGGYVDLEWSGHEHPKDTDWIGVWCPSDAKVTDKSPIKYMKITVSKTWDKGYGKFSMHMNNMRADCKFTLVTGTTGYILAVGSSNTFTFSDFNVPMGIHVAIPTPSGAAGTVSMRVSWNTLNAAKPILRFGSSRDSRTDYAATTSSFTEDNMCDTPAKDLGWISPGSLHTAVVSGLTPGATYYYSVEDEGGPESSRSAIYTVTAPPLPGSKQDLKIIAFGDMGNTNEDGSLQHSWDYSNHGEENSINTTRRIESEVNGTDYTLPLSLVLHIGDISYAVGYMAEWDNFLAQVQPVASVVPWMTAIGNHEMGGPDTFYNGSDSGGECGLPYAARFIMPAPADNGKADAPWYGFVHGQVHIIVMSTEHDFNKGTDQYAFLEAEFGRVDRSVTPWVIFTGHRPMYEDSSDPSSDSGMTALRTALEELLYDNRVDLVLWGHNHSYQRTCKVHNLKCGATSNTTAPAVATPSSDITPAANTTADSFAGPVHAVIGMAGYWLTEDLPSTKAEYIEVAYNKYWGFMRLNVNTTHMHVEFVEDRYGDIKDDFTLEVQQF